MNTPITKAQIIEQNGIPAFAVIPYHEYLKLISMAEDDENAVIPHEVVELMVEKTCNLVRAWRLHLGKTQKEVAVLAGITQSAMSQIERTENSRSATLEKLAAAMGLSISQLTD
jgi:DNA-binding XRE family transcriptional regulator